MRTLSERGKERILPKVGRAAAATARMFAKRMVGYVSE